MAKVIGFRKSSFKGDSGDQLSGVNLYVSFPLDNGEGNGAERVFLLDRRLAECGYVPKLGDEVRVEYNRFGKAAGVYKV